MLINFITVINKFVQMESINKSSLQELSMIQVQQGQLNNFQTPTAINGSLCSILPLAKEYCRNHPNKQACYFSSDEPWSRMCSKCALNMALCGKKIEKRLSDQEMKKKYQLQSVIYQLKYNLKNVEDKEETMKDKINQMDNSYINITEKMLKFYDSNIEEWTKQRNELYKFYMEQLKQFGDSMKNLNKSLIIAKEELKKDLQDIQTNTGIIIHEMEYQKFKISIEGYKSKVQSLLRDVKNNDKQFQFDIKKFQFGECVDKFVKKYEQFKVDRLQNLKKQLGLQNTTSDNSNNTTYRVNKQENEKNQLLITPTIQNNIAIKTQVKENQSQHVKQNSNLSPFQNESFHTEQIKLKLKPLQSSYVTVNGKTRNRTASKLPLERDPSKSPMATSKLRSVLGERN